MSEPAACVRLVVSDIDGTLVTKSKQLTPRAIAAARRLREAGIGLALVSSRPARGMVMFLEELGIDTPRAGFNGGEIVSPDGRVLESLFVPDAAARQAVLTLDANGIDAWVFADDAWYVTKPDGHYVPFEHRTVRIEPTVVANFDAVIGRAGKIMGSTTDHDRLAEVEHALGAALAGQATVHRSQDYYLDITHGQANKGYALGRLAALLGVAVGETASLGDMPNDVPMLLEAGLSIAMGQAPEIVRASAMFSTASNEQDGWAEAIETLILPRAPRG